ncbi:MAG: histidinol-phosphate transaminase [Arcobacter sp.]|jgi:histidinol-phosphate aminotransferase|uniref:Histidinol-phosphate aminotransferase n=1 Tax=Arcobacter defluvii TaxID=873191 RepID=A0AAE7BG65_9BACT|nr:MULTISPECIES: histidinol-phosphate transaminase [Arcobacter]MDY3199466.1 histidinol-phosphate transaminase [Arcobacter sp.]QKF78701.1 histidinol-phosphate aminotransferase [Arcobacter defluvii]RXI33985.1 histidinol-phosphate transaminase [Arcobacter defluvii]BAK74478.1 histidinol-phosphate aminotransferase [Arcobacter sp. L]
MKFNEVLENVSIYEAGKPIELVVREYGVKPENVIKLASNENPYGTSPKVIAKIQEIAKNMFVYPDDSMFELKEALAKKFEVESENVIIGSGSDQIIEFCIHAKCQKGSKILMAKTTFAMYEIYGKQAGATIIKTDSEQHNLEEFSKLYKEHGADVIFLCIPNNPLGECVDKDDVYAFLQTVSPETLIVVDGAYQEYASFKDEKKRIVPKDLMTKFPNAIYLGTFSKAYALGGMRVGYGIAQADIIQTLYKLRAPFNITTLTLAAAIEALKDEDFVKSCIAKNFEEMTRYEEYATKKGFEYIPSYTNFITIKMGDKFVSKVVAQKLLERGVIVRDLTGYGQNAIRITIGRNEQNTKVFEQLDEVLENLK